MTQTESETGPSLAARRAALLLLLSAATALSQFYRVSNSVIAPELTRDLGLTKSDLGWAGGAFFLALLVAQIPSACGSTATDRAASWPRCRCWRSPARSCCRGPATPRR
ncbi:MAG: hypothetical protein IPK81_01500 [Rhodospirillales bacterium]|nr:MAG: hypothetical protein IPK81_01500 [Rhodospirillales bacterium]